MQLAIQLLFFGGVFLAVLRPVALLYILVFILLEPSRRLSLDNFTVLGTVNLKFCELVMFLLFFGVLVRRCRSFLACLMPSMVLFLLFALLSLGRGLNERLGEAAFNMFRPFASMGMCVAVPLLFRRPGDFAPLLRFFFVTMLAAGTADFLDVLHINPLASWMQSEFRTMSVLGGTQGSMLAMIFLYTLCIFRFIKRNRGIVGACMVYAAMLALLSGSRGVWLGTMGSVIILVLFLPLRRKVTIGVSVVLLSVFLLVLVQSFYLERYNISVIERLQTVFDPDEGTARWRIEAWRQMLDDIRERPVLGWEFGTEPSFDVITAGLREVVAPHNEYLKIARYTGLAGLSTFFWFLVATIVPAVRFFQRNRGSRAGYEELGLLLCFIMHIQISFVTQQYTTLDIAPIIWCLVGMISVYLFAEQETAPPLKA